MTRHFAEILKTVSRDLWQETEGWQKDIIAADMPHITSSFNWFNKTVMAKAQEIYENPDRY